MLDALAIVLNQPGRVTLTRLPVTAPESDDVVIATRWSGVSTGTERLLFTGRMPDFPGMGYPLVPGYETVGEIVEAKPETGFHVGQTVFVPGAKCFGPVRSLFGGAAALLVDEGVAYRRPVRVCRRKGRAPCARRDRLSRARRLGAEQRRPHRRAWRSWPPAGATLHACGQRAADSVGTQPGARGRRAAVIVWLRPRAIRAATIAASST